MKEISIKIDDELYRRASRSVGNLEAEVSQHVTEYLEAISGDDGYSQRNRRRTGCRNRKRSEGS